jgi:predicted RNase H-like HicB family nuclease
MAHDHAEAVSKRYAVFREFRSCNKPNYNSVMSFDDYKLVIYRNRPDGWVAEIPAIAGCHALMPTAEEAVGELAKVFQLIQEEHRASGRELPRDFTEIVHA